MPRIVRFRGSCNIDDAMCNASRKLGQNSPGRLSRQRDYGRIMSDLIGRLLETQRSENIVAEDPPRPPFRNSRGEFLFWMCESLESKTKENKTRVLKFRARYRAETNASGFQS